MGRSETVFKVMLTAIDGPQIGQMLEIKSSIVRIGRDQDCELRLDGEEVSREHCQLRIEGQVVWICDDSSSNGTYVNRRRLRGELQVEHGDAIQIGPHLFTLSVEREPHESGEDHEDVLSAPEIAVGDATLISNKPVLDPGAFEPLDDYRLEARLRELKQDDEEKPGE